MVLPRRSISMRRRESRLSTSRWLAATPPARLFTGASVATSDKLFKPNSELAPVNDTVSLKLPPPSEKLARPPRSCAGLSCFTMNQVPSRGSTLMPSMPTLPTVGPKFTLGAFARFTLPPAV